MTGQRHDDIVSLVVLALDNSGRQIGWHVFNVDEMTWEFAGIGDNGSKATVKVAGDFHRMDRQALDALNEAGLEIGDGS